jgi:heme-degrading monooxygenase HmoA
VANADAYQRHFCDSVVPHLQALQGYRGAYLLRHEAAGEVEFVAVTLWETMEAIRQFAGSDPAAAVVEPTARALLSRFDSSVAHHVVAYAGTHADS